MYGEGGAEYGEGGQCMVRGAVYDEGGSVLQ